MTHNQTSVRQQGEYFNSAARQPVLEQASALLLTHPIPYAPSHIPAPQATVSSLNSVSQRQISSLSVEALERASEQYLCDCDLRLLSPRTLDTRRVFLGNFLWFLRQRGYANCGTAELRQFFHYLMHGHEEPGGRFGNKHLTRPVRPITVMDYYTCLRTFFDWLVMQRTLQETPFLTIAKPLVRETVKNSLSPEQITALLRAASQSSDPLRNTAIVTFLLDTGCRASELISIRLRDLDLANRRCKVRGKGNKDRLLFFGQATAATLTQFLSANLASDEDTPDHEARYNDAQDGDAPLFPPVRGRAAFTRSGLLHLIKRLGERAGIKDAASVHALRRSFAVQMLRNGANVFTVQAILGHTTLQQTRKYCVLALTDAEAQHRQCSPMDRLAYFH